ncbi:type II toxin-antitoxin system PemK/MazF family toxin [Streptomyces sp. NPDC050315]|uniref:type II toxin-antitoxin system PemK/MazF family toxin n=1 Tax=Streptomyces sp. NPDC050315 TaxID=3155039 RepID=UPI003413758C
MDTSWWPAVLAVVVLALVVALVDGRARSDRGPRRGRRRETGLAAPEPGEIWWAAVPYEDTAAAKDRPCLVLAVRGRSALVAKITSRYHDERPGVIPLRPGTVGDAQGRPSFLETDELREVAVADFRRRAGTADPLLWDQVRHLAR